MKYKVVGHIGPKCPYCIGVERDPIVVDVNDGIVEIETDQRAHDRACPASSAPLGSVLSPHDMTAEMIADARRQRRPIHGRV